MKTLKNIILLILPLTIMSCNLYAQEKQKLDKMPEPVEGIIKNVVYPEKAKEEKLEGKVIVKAMINEKGDVEKAYVEEGVNKLLDDAAINAVKATKFTPGELNGKKVKAEIIVPIKFKLCNEKKT